MGSVNCGKEKLQYCRIKDENRRLAMGKDKVLKALKDYFEDLYFKEQVAVHVCSFGGVHRGNCFVERQFLRLKW